MFDSREMFQYSGGLTPFYTIFICMAQLYFTIFDISTNVTQNETEK